MRMPELFRRWSDMAVPVMAQVPEAKRDPLESRAITAGSLLSLGASTADLDALKSRLYRRVPADLSEVLRASNGFVIPSLGDGPSRFLSSREIALFHRSAPDAYDAWCAVAGSSDPVAARSNLYGEEQQEFEVLTNEALREALLLSSVRDGEVLLACPDAFNPFRKTEDWTYCKLSRYSRNIRFGSLYMVISYLIDRSLPVIQPIEAFE